MNVELLVSAAVAFSVAILSGLGVGSGGLLMIWLTMVMKVEAIQARGINLLFFIFSASSALIFHLRRRKLKIGLVLMLSVFAVMGTFLGAYVAGMVDSLWIRRIFGGMLVLSGLWTLFGKKT